MKTLLTEIGVSLKILFKFIVYLMALMCFLSLVVSGDYEMDCLDIGGVWDGEFEECRFDCLSWDETTGCVLMSDEELEKYVSDYCDKGEKDLLRCRKKSLELSKRRLRDKQRKSGKEDTGETRITGNIVGTDKSEEADKTPGL